jgi:V/A-type H+/Na+-transporting ATPase subunit I
MFRSQSMRKVEIIVPEHDIIAVTQALAKSESFHITSSSDPGDSEGAAPSTLWVDQGISCLALTQRLSDLMDALNVDPGEPSEDVLRWISPDFAERDIESLEREAREPVRKLKDAGSKLAQLESARDQLVPFIGLDIDLQGFRDSQYVFSMFGLMPSENVERLRTSLEQIPTALLVFGARGHLAAVGLFGMIRDIEILRRAARSGYLTPLSVPTEYRGTVRDTVESLDASIARTREHIDSYQSRIHQLQEVRIHRMQHLLWRLRSSQHIISTISGFRQFKYTYLVVGWVPGSDVARVKTSLDAVSEGVVVKANDLRGEDRRRVPFRFRNPPVVRLFEQLVTIYSYPRYDELDPTPLVAITFPIIFGVMFGDFGHGLFLLLLGLLMLSRKVKALASAAKMGGIVVTCGVTSMIFGLLYGSFFGSESVLPAIWLRPLEQTQEILVVSVVFGILNLVVGMVFNMVGCARRGNWGEALFGPSGLTGFLFYGAMIGLGAGLLVPDFPDIARVLLPVLLTAGLGLAASGFLIPLIEGRLVPRGEIGMLVAEGFFELFEAFISLLSNTLSYVRMGAFAVAHGALSLVVFILAELVNPGRGLGYWLVVALGNLFVIGFEGMIVAIQTLRLEYYELFSKFFTGGGVQFSPLRMLPADRVS